MGFGSICRQKRFPVIPVMLPGCEPPLGFMKQLMWIELRDNPADPISSMLWRRASGVKLSIGRGNRDRER